MVNAQNNSLNQSSVVGKLRHELRWLTRPFVARPWASPLMEYEFGVWRGVSALMSESGRQLGEESARPLSLNQHLSAEIATCPYDDVRKGKPMNMSALREAMRCFEPALSIIGAVRSRVMRELSIEKENLGVADLYIVSRACVSLVAFRQRKLDLQCEGDVVSSVLTSQYQFVSGVFMIGRDMIEKGDQRMRDNVSMSASELFEYAAQNSIFESPNGMVCAGSARKIQELLEFVVSGDVVTKSPLPETDLAKIVGDVDAWYRYALATIELDAFVDHACLARPESKACEKTQSRLLILEHFIEAAGGKTSDTASVSNQGFEDGVLVRQNQILEILGRARIRHLPIKITQRRTERIFPLGGS